ncbi:MAG: hypothetical protein AAB425_04925, partial [Bdellovibrionota bacterium]
WIFAIAVCSLSDAAASLASSWGNGPWSSDFGSPPPPAASNPGGNSPAPKVQRKASSLGLSGNSAVSPFSPGSNNISIDVGQVFLMGDLSDRYTDSLGSRFHYTYGVSDLFAFDGSFGYSSHSDGDYTLTSLLTGLRVNLAWYDKVIPFGVFGMGFYMPSYLIKPNERLSPIVFGLHVGAGVELELTKQLFFGTALTLHNAFTTTKQTVVGPREVGGSFASFIVHGGVTF